jgi:hypothetical protein
MDKEAVKPSFENLMIGQASSAWGATSSLPRKSRRFESSSFWCSRAERRADDRTHIDLARLLARD